MNRRTLLASAGGGLAALVGGTTVANATRADIVFERDLHRGQGDEATIEKVVTDDDVEYLSDTNEVRRRGYTVSFETWGRRKCFEVASDDVRSIINERLDTAVEGIGSGVRGLLFDFVAVADLTTHRARDGSILSEPNVTLDEVVSVAPRTIHVTVSLDGREYSEDVPVAVRRSESHQL